MDFFKNKITVFLVAFALLFAGCASSPYYKVFANSTENSCLVDAALYKAIYTHNNNLKSYYWSEILIVRWNVAPVKGGPTGHAVCMYQVNKKLFAYDTKMGSVTVPLVYKDTPKFIANYLYGASKIASAHYMQPE